MEAGARGGAHGGARGGAHGGARDGAHGGARLNGLYKRHLTTLKLKVKLLNLLRSSNNCKL